MLTALRLAALALLIGLNALFVAVEFSLVAADRTRVAQETAAGSAGAARAARLLGRLSFHLSGAQLAITSISLLLGFVAEPTVAAVIGPALEPLLGRATSGVSIGVALVAATVIQMVLGELVPKALAISRAHQVVIRLAPLALAYGAVFGPVVKVMNRLADGTVRRLGVEPREELATTRTLEELLFVIETAADEGELDPSSRQLLERSIRFRAKTAVSAMVPRVDVTALPAAATLAELAATSARTGFSRFPVYGDDLDDIVGVIHVKRLFAVPYEQRALTPVSTLMDEPFVVPESRDLDSVLVEMGATGSHLAVVADEYGGTAGILTAEDVVEEIVGTIDDEHDPRTPPLVARDGDAYLLVGTLHGDEVDDACGFTMPEGDYETLAGFLLDRFGGLPREGDEVGHDGWTFTVAQMDRRRIARVRAVPPGEEGVAPAAHPASNDVGAVR